MTTLPTYEQLTDLPPVLAGLVTQDQLDANGHMTVAAYFRLGDQSLADRLIALGLGTGAGVNADGTTTFVVEHHVRYLGELRPGEKYSCHALIIGRSARAVHGLTVVLSRTGRQLACCFEAIVVNVDLATRRAAPFARGVAAALDSAIAADQAYPGQALAGGALALR